MKRYFVIARNSFMTELSRRASFIFAFLGNILYLTVIYFLWSSIYKNNTEINGMTFNEVFVYLALASSMAVMFQVYTEWFMSRDIISGNIITDIIKPLDYQFNRFCNSLGGVFSNFLTITVPSFLLILLVFQAGIQIRLNFLFFILAVIFALIIAFLIDYMIGLLSFYTESIWGISITKEVVVLFFSGALVPLAFFPEPLREVVQLLPFQAIYNTPLTILITPTLQASDYLTFISVQLFWISVLFILSRFFHHRALKVITINGG
ncbi:ABC-2 family transporter protein [Paenibacillus sp. FJAT-26967]|uniref:ABC transporter permease n=1 Tax=Paenibacillus sp. FJAT-26967 TaxID=1729690 RepID=UPI000837ED75|nr:ABC-2 family transporter protein [Paenibacillus sp. FJAT-26967]